ncbi:MAG: hypothetical protein HN348_18830 [Proteobacteria bacterium]|jgi:endonuclease/exonuclease/phosphatase family metal-dependent hydrolase|nr:hypothetical protein [Pseudomonadota bacterium]
MELERPMFFALLFMALMGCPPSNESDLPSGKFTAATYNVGLAVGYVPAADYRAPLAAEALANVGADLVCAQEVWLPGQIGLLTAATEDTLPNTFLPDAMPEDAGGAGCTEDELAQLMDCADQACEDVCDDKVIDCIFDNCPLQFLGLEKTCQSCVMAAVGSDVEETKTTCTTANPLFAYGGAFGTALLTSMDLSDTDELLFASTTNRRSVLYGLVDTPLGETHVFCTHLTAVFSMIPYPKEEGSWAEEQAAQVEEFLDYIDEKAGSEPVLVLGDMNMGPDSFGIDGEQEEHYNTLSDGFVNPYIDDDGQCTYCDDNPLNAGNITTEIIDHILLRDHQEVTAESERILDEAIDAERCGETIDAAYSDHYGVMTTLSR